MIIEFGLDDNGKRVSIFNADRKRKYVCPCCKGELIQKRGRQMIWHFAHKSLENCVDYYDNKGVWHRQMQELFPEKNREVFNNEFGRHFYDVLTDMGTIIEFQKSPISIDSFEDRTFAYVCYMDKHARWTIPIWVFNYTERKFWVLESNTERFGKRNRALYWDRPTKIFSDYQASQAFYELWFVLSPFEGTMEQVQYGAGTWDSRWIRTTVHHKTGYIKVKRILNDGKNVYGDIYSEKEFVRHITKLR